MTTQVPSIYLCPQSPPRSRLKKSMVAPVSVENYGKRKNAGMPYINSRMFSVMQCEG